MRTLYLNELITISFCGLSSTLVASASVPPGSFRLKEAIRSGDVEILRSALERARAGGIDIKNARGECGDTLVHYAATQKSTIPMLELLCRLYDVDVNARDKRGWTPLYAAILVENCDAILCLLQLGADLYARIPSDRLQTINIRENDRTCLDGSTMLLLYPVEPREASEGYMSIHYAIYTKKIAAVQTLLQWAQDRDVLPFLLEARGPDGKTPLETATIARHEKLITLLKSFGA